MDGKSRFIEYYVLSSKENAGFFRKNQELPEILLDAVFNNQINIFDLDYDTGKEARITAETLADNLRKLEDLNQVNNYHPDEISLMGIDLTEGYKADEVYYHFNYINLYVPYYNSATTKNIYVGSFRFNEVLELLDAKEILWYPESFGLANGIFTNYGGFTMEQTTFSKNLLEEVKNGHLDASFNESVNISTYTAQDGYSVDLHIREMKNNGVYMPVALELHKALHELKNGEDSYICSVPFEDFREYLNKAGSNHISWMSNTLLKRRFTSPTAIWRSRYENFYDPNFSDREVIAENGKFIKSNQTDLLSSGNKLVLQKVNNRNLSKRRFSLRQTELLDLRRVENEVLLRKGNELTRLIIDAAQNGALSIYSSDSLKNPMTLATFNGNLELTGVDAPSLPDGLYLLRLIYEVCFDRDGENKTYRPLGLGILALTEHPDWSYNQSIGYFRFESLKEILTKDDKEEHHIIKPYLEVLLNRDFKSFIKESSHITISKK